MNKRILITSWFGEFGIYLMQVLPKLNKLFDEGYKITFGGYKDDLIYIKRQFGPYILENSIEFDWWPSDRGSFACKSIPEKIKERHNAYIVNKRKEQFDEIIDLCNITASDYVQKFRNGGHIFKRFTANKLDQYKESVIFFPRGNKNSWSEDKNWSLELCNDILALLAMTFKHVYVGGIKEETRGSFNCDNITYLTHLLDRVEKTIDILNNCQAAISNVSGGSIAALYSGCPTIIFGKPENSIYYIGQGNRNYLGTPCEYSINSDKYDIYDDIMKFIKQYRGRNDLAKNQVIL